MPIVLAAGAVWVSWRAVNWPTFADFLIATEAEINKVSWTTRKRLVQDTIVVLVAVFLMTAFLFVVDILWIKVLTNPWVQVLQVDIKSEFQRQQEKTQW
jgi:preprotein translocase SecE subunit